MSPTSNPSLNSPLGITQPPSGFLEYGTFIIRPEAIPEFAYRRVTTTGEFVHAHEILLGPRTREGMLGYHVITPLVRDYDGDGTGGSTILVNRGFVGREKVDQRTRPESLVRSVIPP